MRLEEAIKQEKFNSEYQKGMINIIYTFNWIDNSLKQFFKEYDLTPQQFNILRILRGRSPKPATINLLKERMLDKMCDASRLVERLRVKGLLERSSNADDRRAVDITITRKGLKLLESIDKVLEPHNTELMSSLTENEVKELNKLLDKLRSRE